LAHCGKVKKEKPKEEAGVADLSGIRNVEMSGYGGKRNVY
jgi:hypothetical protein